MEKKFFIFIIISLFVVGVLAAVRIYILHDYDFYTESSQVPNQAIEFERNFLQFFKELK